MEEFNRSLASVDNPYSNSKPDHFMLNKLPQIDATAI
jgi:hypothetical protein